MKVFETDEIFHYALFDRKYLNFENQILALSTLYLNFYTQDEFLYLGKIIQSGFSNLPSGYPDLPELPPSPPSKLYFFEIA